jgi:hypothetical protein
MRSGEERDPPVSLVKQTRDRRIRAYHLVDENAVAAQIPAIYIQENHRDLVSLEKLVVKMVHRGGREYNTVNPTRIKDIKKLPLSLNAVVRVTEYDIELVSREITFGSTNDFGEEGVLYVGNYQSDDFCIPSLQRPSDLIGDVIVLFGDLLYSVSRRLLDDGTVSQSP